MFYLHKYPFKLQTAHISSSNCCSPVLSAWLDHNGNSKVKVRIIVWVMSHHPSGGWRVQLIWNYRSEIWVSVQKAKFSLPCLTFLSKQADFWVAPGFAICSTHMLITGPTALQREIQLTTFPWHLLFPNGCSAGLKQPWKRHMFSDWLQHLGNKKGPKSVMSKGRLEDFKDSPPQNISRALNGRISRSKVRKTIQKIKGIVFAS